MLHHATALELLWSFQPFRLISSPFFSVFDTLLSIEMTEDVPAGPAFCFHITATLFLYKLTIAEFCHSCYI